MTEEEIRAEIERQKNKARDMKLREKVWELYNSNFQYIDTHVKADPGVILPEIRQSLIRAGESSEFRFKEQACTAAGLETIPVDAGALAVAAL